MTDITTLECLADALDTARIDAGPGATIILGERLASEISTELRAIAGRMKRPPDAVERKARTARSLIRRIEGDVAHVWCESCQAEHFMTREAIERPIWRLPCGMILRARCESPI